MPRKAWLLQLSRKGHLYVGLLISPALLFFAFTGAIQTLGYHEASSNYRAPALLESLGQIHKKQTYLLPGRRGPVATSTSAENSHKGSGATIAQEGAPDPTQASHSHAPAAPQTRPGAQTPPTLQAKQKQHLPLKLFFVLVSLGLFTNTFTGIYMAYKYDRNKVLVTLLLVAGLVLPIVLIRF